MYLKRGRRELQLVSWRELSQGTTPTSLATPTTLSLVPSLSRERAERESSVASVGWHLLEHNAVASSTLTFEDPRSYPYPLPPSGPKLTAVEGDPWESAKRLHFGGPGKGIYLPRQLSSRRPVTLPPLPQPSPSSGMRGGHVSSPTDGPLALRPALRGEQPWL